MVKCPCCGAPSLPRNLTDLTSHEHAFAQALRERRGEWVTAQYLFDQVYGDDPNGGPLMGMKMVHIYVHKLRRKLGADVVETRGWRKLGGYRWVAGETTA